MIAGKERERIVVVGGGLGGLAAAVTLAARGRQVTLLEQNAFLGGKAAVLNRDGFRFDMGPTILTVPSVLRRIFAEAGRRLGLDVGGGARLRGPDRQGHLLPRPKLRLAQLPR